MTLSYIASTTVLIVHVVGTTSVNVREVLREQAEIGIHSG